MKTADPVASAADDGCILDPQHRPRWIKNGQRWTTGDLLPRAYCANHIEEASALRVECLVEGDTATALDIDVRFLQVIDGTDSAEQHAVERRLSMPRETLREILVNPLALRAVFAGESGARKVEAVVHTAVAPVAEGTFKVRVDVANATLLDEVPARRDDAMTSALAACHVVLQVEKGAFVSLFDPPQRLIDESRGCMNAGVWPILVGAKGARDIMLASPIILHDHPEIGPETPLALSDDTEIDEILTLRILAMADHDKRDSR